MLELLLDREGEKLILRSPEVGLFTRALAQGALVGPRSHAGVLHSLGRRFELVTPEGVAGRVVNARPEAVLAPVGFGTALYELAPLEAVAAGPARKAARSTAGERALVLRAPYSGRFWHRPAPSDPPFVAPGDVLVEGRTVGLIEVMKTFTHLAYHAAGELPPRARLVRFVVPDGGEVKDGGALLELERA